MLAVCLHNVTLEQKWFICLRRCMGVNKKVGVPAPTFLVGNGVVMFIDIVLFSFVYMIA